MIRIAKDNAGIFNGQSVLMDDMSKKGLNFLVKSVKNHPQAIKSFLQERDFNVSGISNYNQLLGALMDALFKGDKKLIEDFVTRIISLNQYSNIDPIVTPIILGVTALITWGKSSTDKKTAETQAQTQLQSELLAAQKEKQKQEIIVGLSILGGLGLLGGLILYSFKKKNKK